MSEASKKTFSTDSSWDIKIKLITCLVCLRLKLKENCFGTLFIRKSKNTVYKIFFRLGLSEIGRDLYYSRVHISSDEVFSKILKKPTIVQKKMIPHMKDKVIFVLEKYKKNLKKKMAD